MACSMFLFSLALAGLSGAVEVQEGCVASAPSSASALGQALLQTRTEQELTSIDEDEEDQASIEISDAAPPAMPDPIPICYHTIVSETCRKLNDDVESSDVDTSELMDFLATNQSTMDSLFADIGMTVGTTSCATLCSKVIDYIGKQGGVMPPSSDVACYTVDGKTTCDVDVEPHRLAKRMKRINEVIPDADVDDHEEGVPMTQGDEGASLMEAISAEVVKYKSTSDGDIIAESAKGRVDESSLAESPHVQQVNADGSVRYRALLHLAIRVANLFRVHPNSGANLPITIATGDDNGPGLVEVGNEAAVQGFKQEIATLHATSQAWAATVVREMNRVKTESLRNKWFGGSGSISKADVRTRILQTMVFSERELDDDLHYVYPGDSVPNTACGGQTLAFVYKGYYPPRPLVYSESKFPTCSRGESPSRKLCALDGEGKYVVYVCKWFDRFSDWQKVGTIIHEIVHHTGPSDQSYDPNAMRRLSQAKQLDNAANYQNFARDVVETAWDCKEVEGVTGTPYSCSGRPCPCSALADLCDDRSNGAKIRSQCPSTCGACKAPASDPRPNPTPAPPAPTPNPTPVPPAPTPNPTPRPPAPTPRPTPNRPAPTPKPTPTSSQTGQWDVDIVSVRCTDEDDKEVDGSLCAGTAEEAVANFNKKARR